MAHIKRKYIDSHWLVFIFQGIIALLFGCLTLFTSDQSSTSLTPVIGVFLLALSIVEFANSVYRSYNRHGWVISTAIAIFDAIFGLLLLFTANETMTWHLVIIAAYTLLRGIFEVVIGFRTTVDPTDRFIWCLCGLCGLLFAIVIFNSGHLANVDFVRFFGAYMLILGVSSLIYSIHNREQQLEDRLARSEAAHNRTEAAKTHSASAKSHTAASARTSDTQNSSED